VSALTDADPRNELCLPPIVVTAYPLAAQTTHVDQSVNKALPWVAFSWFLSGGAVIGLILMALMVPRQIDSRVAQGVSDSKASTAQELAAAKADMDQANMNAQLAKDRIDKAAAALEARGLIKLENH
jgi:hypothetical protein